MLTPCDENNVMLSFPLLSLFNAQLCILAIGELSTQMCEGPNRERRELFFKPLKYQQICPQTVSVCET